MDGSAWISNSFFFFILHICLSISRIRQNLLHRGNNCSMIAWCAAPLCCADGWCIVLGRVWREISVWRDKGKVVDKSPSLSSHMQPCWPHIKTNLLLFSPSTSCPYRLPCGEENALLKETYNKTALFSAWLRCSTVRCFSTATDLPMQTAVL